MPCRRGATPVSVRRRDLHHGLLGDVMTDSRVILIGSCLVFLRRGVAGAGFPRAVEAATVDGTTESALAGSCVHNEGLPKSHSCDAGEPVEAPAGRFQVAYPSGRRVERGPMVEDSNLEPIS